MNGTHVSVEGGLDKAVERLLALNARAGQIYLHSNKSYMREGGISLVEWDVVKNFTQDNRIIVHASYICVLTNEPENNKQRMAVKGLAKDLEYCEDLGLDGIVVHPGRMKTMVDMLHCKMNVEAILRRTTSDIPMILLENACHSLHGRLSNLSEIISYLEPYDRRRVGICLDTAHFWVAGHDVTDISRFEMEILPYRHLIKAVHFNNPKNLYGSHRDGHGALKDGVLSVEQLHEMYCKLRELLGETIPFVIEATEDPNEVKALNIWQKKRRKEISGKLEGIPLDSSTSALP